MADVTFSSSITHGAQSGCPILIAPKMGIETDNPEFPNRTYSALLFSTDVLRDLGISPAMIAVFFLAILEGGVGEVD